MTSGYRVSTQHFLSYKYKLVLATFAPAEDDAEAASAQLDEGGDWGVWGQGRHEIWVLLCTVTVELLLSVCDNARLSTAKNDLKPVHPLEAAEANVTTFKRSFCQYQ